MELSRFNYNEVSLLISEYNPSLFCFQETFLKPDDNFSLKGLNIYNYVDTECMRPSGGASVFVKASFPQKKIDLQAELQATAVSATLDKKITICCFHVENMKQLFQDIHIIDSIMTFLRQINLFNKI